jgi:hypothetical protein
MENDINHRRWKQFLNNINPRKPAPGPDYGIIAKHPANLGNRLWWQQLKSARHGGAKRFTSLRWMPGEWREDDPGNPVWLEPQFSRSTTSTSILPAFRPPSRHKARNLDHFRLICHAEGFVEAVKRGIKSWVHLRGWESGDFVNFLQPDPNPAPHV